MNGLSFFYTGAVGVIVSWILSTGLFSGCRLGNRVEITKSDPPTRLFYYELAPQTLEFCTHTEKTICKKSPTTDIPLFIGRVLSNPVALYVSEKNSQEGYLISIEGKNSYLPIDVFPDQSISFVGQSSEESFMGSETCKKRISIEENGRIVKMANGPVLTNGYPIIGRIELRVTIIEKFLGDCLSELSMVGYCLAERENCPGSSSEVRAEFQKVLLATFGDYLKSQVLLPQQINSLSSMAFEISYE